jgi:uncharacterized protein
MKKRMVLFNWQPDRETAFSFLLFFLSILLNGIANSFKGSYFFFLFYHGLFVVGLCTLVPVLYMSKINQTLVSMGLTLNNWLKAVLYGLLFVCFSLYGRFMNLSIEWPGTDRLIFLIGTLAMASLVEEVFFRGFLQTRFEKSFGVIPAILLSGLTFSLYHLGYPDYQNLQVLTALFFFGIFLAITFKTTNNVVTSFIVNLPHAVISFIEKHAFFDKSRMVISLVTMLIVLFIINKFTRGNIHRFQA